MEVQAVDDECNTLAEIVSYCLNLQTLVAPTYNSRAIAVAATAFKLILLSEVRCR
jgi:hypothetical protein